jgi:hypothetical protein
MKKPKRDRRHVVFAVPTLNGQTHSGTTRTVYGEGMALQHKGDRFSVMDNWLSADIAWSRALAVAEFMASDGTHLMFIDSDVSGPPGCVQRLLNYDLDFAASVYPIRLDPIQFKMHYLPGKPGPIFDAETGLFQIAKVSGGFICLSRAMLARMIRAHPELEFVCSVAPLGRAVALFDHYWYVDDEGPQRLSEDYAFCQRWTGLGGKVLIDPEITLGHTGNKRFTAKLADCMKPAEAKAA